MGIVHAPHFTQYQPANSTDSAMVAVSFGLGLIDSPLSRIAAMIEAIVSKSDYGGVRESALFGIATTD